VARDRDPCHVTALTCICIFVWAAVCIWACESHSCHCHRDGGFVRYWHGYWDTSLQPGQTALSALFFYLPEAVNIREIYNASQPRLRYRYQYRLADFDSYSESASASAAASGWGYRYWAQRIIRSAIRQCRYCICGQQLLKLKSQKLKYPYTYSIHRGHRRRRAPLVPIVGSAVTVTHNWIVPLFCPVQKETRCRISHNWLAFKLAARPSVAGKKIHLQIDRWNQPNAMEWWGAPGIVVLSKMVSHPIVSHSLGLH